MSVRVRMFAALRDAAGTSAVELPAAPLSAVLEALCERFGEPFRTRLSVAAVLIDGEPVTRDTDPLVADGSEIALLPPVSGGAGGAARPPTLLPGMRTTLASSGIALPALAALALGPEAFAVALTLLAVLALLDLSGVLTRASARPVLPAALVPAVGLPVTVAVRPELGWDLVPAFVAAGFLAAFVFALLFGRRKGIVEGAGTTMLSGLVVGLGAASLILMRHLPHGFRWVLAFVLLGAAADVAGPLWAWVGRRDRGGISDGVGAPIGLVIAVGGLLLLLLRPPLRLPVAALMGMIALTATLGGGDLRRSLMAEADAEQAGVTGRLGAGAVLGLVDGLLLGAPVAYVLARSAAL